MERAPKENPEETYFVPIFFAKGVEITKGGELSVSLEKCDCEIASTKSRLYIYE
jgi:hypothetical protein